jgi:hypothetical protein
MRIWTPTVAASIAMATFAVATFGAPWVPCAIFATLVYGAVFLATERIFFPGDFAYYSGVVGPLWRRLSSSRT